MYVATLTVIQHPESINISYNDPAEFSCEIMNASHIFWYINDVTAESIECVYPYVCHDDDDDTRNGTAYYARLIITCVKAKTMLNNSYVHCQGYNPVKDPSTVNSSKALILAQGA